MNKFMIGLVIVIGIVFMGLYIYMNNDQAAERADNDSDTDSIKVFTSIYPIYETARKIAGEKIDIGLVIPNGVEVHSYDPSPKKIAQLENAEVFFYIGEAMEPWVPKAELVLNESDVKAIELSNYLNLISLGNEDEHHEGDHQQADNENHSHVEEIDDHTHEEEIDDHTHEEEVEHQQLENHGSHESYDPHVWLDPMNMKKIAETIKDELVRIDPANRDFYNENHSEYSIKIDELDREYKERLAKKDNEIIIVSHAAFAYLARRYDFEQYAISGIASHGESTPGNIASLIKVAERNDLKYVFKEKQVSNRTVQVLADEANMEVLNLDPFIGLTKEEIRNNEDYFSIMRKNLENLEKALVK